MTLCAYIFFVPTNKTISQSSFLFLSILKESKSKHECFLELYRYLLVGDVVTDVAVGVGDGELVISLKVIELDED